MRVDRAQWHDAVEAAIADGYNAFVTLTGVDDDGPQVWLRLRNAEGDDRVLMTSATNVATITDLLPEADWYEREAAHQFGITFGGNANAVPNPDAPMRKDHLLAARKETPWPGCKEPGESGDRPPSRRRLLPPGVRA